MLFEFPSQNVAAVVLRIPSLAFKISRTFSSYINCLITNVCSLFKKCYNLNRKTLGPLVHLNFSFTNSIKYIFSSDVIKHHLYMDLFYWCEFWGFFLCFFFLRRPLTKMTLSHFFLNRLITGT